MVDRIQLSTPCYMQLDGQWQIALPGCVIDVPDGSKFVLGGNAPATQLSPGEAAGTLGSHGKPTSVRNVRTR